MAVHLCNKKMNILSSSFDVFILLAAVKTSSVCLGGISWRKSLYLYVIRNHLYVCESVSACVCACHFPFRIYINELCPLNGLFRLESFNVGCSCQK